MAKRFYEKVSVQDKDGGFCVMLDGRMLRTPGKVALQFDHEPHAQLVAAEWRDQGDEILPNTMPCTRLMNVLVSRRHQDVVNWSRNFVHMRGQIYYVTARKAPKNY